MEPKEEWVFFREIDWLCSKNNRFNVDTRDFHCGYFWDEEDHKDITTLKNYPHFFYTLEELQAILERLFEESGGAVGWRFLSLDTYPQGWDLKYLRIYRTELGFIICDEDKKALKKEIFEGKINKDVLNAH